MPQSRDIDLSSITAHLILVSDRVVDGVKEDRTTSTCQELLREAGLGRVTHSLVREDIRAIRSQITSALADSHRLVIVLGASGFGQGNEAPEAVREVIAVEIPGVAEQIRAHGLTHTPLAGLSREVVGVTGRDRHAALVIASPGSPGGARDTIDVVVPLLPAIYAQLDEN